MRGIFGSLKFAGGDREQKATDIGAYSWQTLLGQQAVKSGVSVNIDTSMQVSAVLACTRALAEGVAQLPLKLYTISADGSQNEAQGNRLRTILGMRPNDWQTSFEWRETMMFHAVLSGDGFSFINRLRGEIRELLPIPPGMCFPVQDDKYGLTYKITWKDGSSDTLPRSSVLHLRGPSWDGYRGLEPVRLAREAIGLAIATEDAHARLHSNGTRPGGLISLEGVLSPDAQERLKAKLAVYGGTENAFRTMILDQGAKWQPFAMSGVDAQHIQTRMFQIEEICRSMRVSPVMIGHSDKAATFASAEAFMLGHVVHTLMPWVARWEQVIARDLLGGDESLTAKFTMQGLLRGDSASRAAFYSAGIAAGWLTRADVRRLEDLNPLPGLEAPLMPLNMAPVAG